MRHLRVDIQGLEQVLRVDVPPVKGVVAHVLAKVPDPYRVVGGAGDEGAGGEDRLVGAVGLSLLVAVGEDLQAPDAGGVEDERVGFPDL